MAAEIENTRIARAGEGGWIKRPERLGWRQRLLKGDPRRAFEAERRAYRRLSGRALPFPDIIAEGQDYFVLSDAGPTLHDILHKHGADSPLFLGAVRDAARALALLHASGISHGRPALRDICWRDGQAMFIDLERAARRRNGPKGHALDLLIFFYNLLSHVAPEAQAVRQARAAYLGAGGGAIWDRAERLVARLWPLAPALRRLGSALSHKRDFRAIGPIFDLFTPGYEPQLAS
ncbi:MAG: hypothetical protein Q4F71_13020 [Paracoccus sp. (in: a-proteobacteria)]|nr:hypothetical protein [Paracoccus sp. (in: a-proteobacteria)]